MSDPDLQVGDIGGGWWNGMYLDYFLLLTFGGIPWQVIASSGYVGPRILTVCRIFIFRSR